MEKYKVSAAELNSHLGDLIGDLQRSVQRYDEGYFLESRRIAVSLRVLLHSNRYPSLLKRLGRDGMRFVDTSPPFSEGNLLSFHGLVGIMFENSEISYSPLLDTDLPHPLTPFRQWWNATVFADGQTRKMSRADVVLTAADQDGGAHVDGSLRADYAGIRHENALGWLTEHGTPLSGDPCYAAIRQIAHEVLKTFISGYTRTAEDVQASRKKSRISGGKMRFEPHEKQFFVSELISLPVPGRAYVTKIVIDSITTGSVRMVVNSAATEPIVSQGSHSITILAGPEKNSGVIGEYTDAVIDSVGMYEVK